MPVQELDADYVDAKLLVKLLERRYGDLRNVGYTLRGSKWIVDVPYPLSKQDIAMVQQGIVL